MHYAALQPWLFQSVPPGSPLKSLSVGCTKARAWNRYLVHKTQDRFGNIVGGVTAPVLWTGQDRLGLATGGLVEGERYAVGIDAHVGDIVKVQGRAIGANAVNGEGRTLHPIVQIVIVAKPRREVAGIGGLSGVIGRQHEIARLGSGGPESTCPFPRGQSSRMEDSVVDQCDGR